MNQKQDTDMQMDYFNKTNQRNKKKKNLQTELTLNMVVQALHLQQLSVHMIPSVSCESHFLIKEKSEM